MNVMPGGPVQSTHPGSPGTVGFSHKVVIITGLTDDGRYACKDNFGRTLYVNASVQRAKGLPPEVGEHWMVSRDLGGWTFAACLDVPQQPKLATLATFNPTQTIAAGTSNVIMNLGTAVVQDDTGQATYGGTGIDFTGRGVWDISLSAVGNGNATWHVFTGGVILTAAGESDFVVAADVTAANPAGESYINLNWPFVSTDGGGAGFVIQVHHNSASAQTLTQVALVITQRR